MWTQSTTHLTQRLESWESQEHLRQLAAEPRTLKTASCFCWHSQLNFTRNGTAIGELVSLNYLVGNTDIELDKSILDKVISIQKLPDEDKTCIMYSLDGLIQHAKTRIAYK